MTLIPRKLIQHNEEVLFMIEAIYSSQNLINEIQKSPFSKLVETFAIEHFNEGYSLSTIKTKLVIVIKFVRWSAYNSITPQKLKKSHIENFKAELSEQSKQIKNGTRLSLYRFICIIEKSHQLNIVDKKLSRSNRCEKIQTKVQIFEEYMRNDKGLTETSIVRFKTTIRQFLIYVFPNSNCNLKKIQASDILNFLRERGQYFKDRTLRCDGSAIKCYMKFLYGKGIMKSDLSHAVPQFSIWRNQNIIHTISEKEMIQMLDSCDVNDKVGVRDYAILLLLMRYGFRPIELIKLRLKDIIWNEKKLLIQAKGKCTVLPLESDVEEALKRYIQFARPRTQDKEVFIRSKAPFIRFEKSGAISSVVRHSLDRCNLKPAISGARLLRYSVASNILNKGGSLQEVSELLRHTSMNTSVRYTRLDMNKLKQVPLGWPTTWGKES